MRTASPPAPGDEELVIFLTGNELGSLRPCGCSGGQLGGIEKRSAVFNTVPASRRLVLATGGLVRGDGEQDLMKCRILFEAFKLLDYDVVRLTGRDHEIAARVGVLEDPQPSFQILTGAEQGRPAVLTKRVMMGGHEIAVNFGVSGAWSSFSQMPGSPAVNILILEEGAAADAVGDQMSGIHCVVSPSESDEPQLLSKPGEMPMVLSVGRFGRYVCRLGVTILPEDRTRKTEDGGRRTEGDPTHFKHQTSNIKLGFESIPIKEHLPDDAALVQLYRQYKQLVSQSDLLERYPRIPLGNDLKFVGSSNCKGCHALEYEQWKTTGHSHALDTLKKVGSDRDPECVLCHVSGLEYEGGYFNEPKTPHLAGVGCENCHGPGSQHVLTAGQAVTTEPKTTCIKCHTPEQSMEFAGHEEEFMKKIMHWREPAAAGKVKEK
jgi:hypothetical protein